MNGNSDAAEEMKLPAYVYIYNQNMMEQLVHMALLTKSNSGTSIKSKGRAH